MEAAQTMNSEQSSMGGVNIDGDEDQFLTFVLDGEEYGVDILRVQEIKGWDAVTSIPNTPDCIRGVINLRGTIVPIIDLRLRFNLEYRENSKTTVVIVLKVNDPETNDSRVMGIVVDGVSDVYNIPPSEIKPAPDFGANVDTKFVFGLTTVEKKVDGDDSLGEDLNPNEVQVKVEEKMVILLNIDHTLNCDDLMTLDLMLSNTTVKENPTTNTTTKSESTESKSADSETSTVDEDPHPLGLNVSVLEASFNLLEPQAELLVERFYDELFKRHPAVEPLFANTTPKKQQQKLLAALKLVIANLNNVDVLAKALTEMGARHQGYGAEPDHYVAVTSTLLDVMQELAGEAWTDEIQTAWSDALNVITKTMLDAYSDDEK